MGKGFVLNMGVGLPSPFLEVDKVVFLLWFDWYRHISVIGLGMALW